MATPATSRERPWRLVAVGDILLGGSATRWLAIHGHLAPFTTTAPWIRGADLAYGNLEGPVATRGRRDRTKRFTFRMAPPTTEALRAVGFDVLHLANNHILDYGPAALDETLTRLDAAGLAHCGAGRDLGTARAPAVVTAVGLRFAFLCYSLTYPEHFWATRRRAGAAFGHDAWIAADVAAARTRADVVVVGFHWGAERMRRPKPYQRRLAQVAVEAGADLVLGHHPHVLQPLAWIAGRPVLYSLGNFVFGSYSRRVSESALVEFTGVGRRIVRVRALPIDVYNPRVEFVPRPLPPRAAARVARTLLGGPVVRDPDGWYRRVPAPETRRPAPTATSSTRGREPTTGT